jgi:hypothetical protein
MHKVLTQNQKDRKYILINWYGICLLKKLSGHLAISSLKFLRGKRLETKNSVTVAKCTLKVLSSEMDPAEIRLIR